MSLSHSKQERIDALLAQFGVESRRATREMAWKFARQAATKPRSYRLQDQLGRLYDHPLVYRALNQADLSQQTGKLFYSDGEESGEITITPHSWATMLGKRVAPYPLAPLRLNEEIVVCRLILRSLAGILKAQKNRRWDNGPNAIANTRQLMRTEIVRLANARAQLAREGAMRGLVVLTHGDYAQDDPGFTFDQRFEHVSPGLRSILADMQPAGAA